ncbi:MAG: hypothetical protein K2L46_00620 [Paramuribaculum sp.]|nr:hypothetical protein [Paramuribaculum sp.]MDE6487761.1 hypothetical protein [Paramuribaculum sp.]
MTSFFKKIGTRINRLADVINGTASVGSVAASQPQPDAVDSAEDDRPTTERELFNNAIDKRDRAIRFLVDEFRESTGSDSRLLESLYINVIVDREEFDVRHYAWADESFKKQLRLELDNAMLSAVGRKNLEIKFVTSGQLPAGAMPVVEDVLYYSFVSAPKPARHFRAVVSIIEGTGSLAKEKYILDSSDKKTYFIGRGPMANKPGAIRPNDIVIRDNDPDATLQQNNNCVSSAHAEITAGNGRFMLKACKWGCRPLGGSPTKIIYDGDEHEVMDTFMKHPLNDNYLIRLGNKVVLRFNTITD